MAETNEDNMRTTNNILFNECADCDEKFEDLIIGVNETAEGDVCDDCFEDYSSCGQCGKVYQSDSMEFIDDEFCCDSCQSRCAFQCVECGDYHLDNNNNYITVRYNIICENCASEYILCHQCNEYYHFDTTCCGNGELADYCSGGYPSYNFGKKFALENDSKPNHFLGAEIEVSYDGSDARRDAESLQEILGTYLFDYTSDCSLENGVEVISAPITLDFWKEKVSSRISEFFDNFDSMNLTTQNAGLHVHISRGTFGAKGLEAMATLFYALPDFQHFIKWLSRRNDNFYFCELTALNWATDKLRGAKDFPKNNRSKYVAMNVTKDATIEIRIFKAARSEAEFWTTLETVEALSLYCQTFDTNGADSSDASLYGFVSFVADNAGRYPHVLAEIENYLNLADLDSMKARDAATKVIRDYVEPPLVESQLVGNDVDGICGCGFCNRARINGGN